MTDTSIETTRTPGIVIFVAILNFIWVGIFSLMVAASAAALAFGNLFGIYDYITKQVTTHYQAPNVSFSVNALFGVFFGVSLGFLLFFLFLGLGLLKGRRLAWYFQIAMSTLGLLGFPIGTILNGAILVLFFQAPIRDHFKV